jgi:hypothetical protein
MVLIGIMGKIRSGKSTAANHLVSNYQFVEKSFAEPLKLGCKEIFILSDEQVFGTQEQKEAPDDRWWGHSGREILQFVGTQLLRKQLKNLIPEIGEDIFVHSFELWYKKEIMANPNLRVVISDVRFQNEFDCIKRLGGIVIKINRPDIKSTSTHESEIEMDKIINYDHLIQNNCTDKYFVEIDNIIRPLLE